MRLDTSAYQRRRALSNEELDAIPWIHLLLPLERERFFRTVRASRAWIQRSASVTGAAASAGAAKPSQFISTTRAAFHSLLQKFL